MRVHGVFGAQTGAPLSMPPPVRLPMPSASSSSSMVDAHSVALISEIADYQGSANSVPSAVMKKACGEDPVMASDVQTLEEDAADSSHLQAPPTTAAAPQVRAPLRYSSSL